MENTPNLSLPYIMPSQAQKHVTHNEAIRRLDALAQLSVAAEQADPPAEEPADGTRFLVAATAGGAWAGQEGRIAAWQDGGWVFLQPREGWRTFVADIARLKVHSGGAWQPLAIDIEALDGLDHLGVNAAADATNRLAVSAPATLLDHEGDDHRLVVNKAAAGDTASLVFQTGYAGRAEFGTAGDDDFRVKVADDSAVWRDSLVADRHTGAVRFPSGIDNPQLHGVLDDLTGFDRLYVDAVNGNDAHDGKTAATALKSAAGLAARFSVGRKLEIRLLSDIVFDWLIQIGYVVPSLLIYGRLADDSDWTNRKITVVDSVNYANHPGSFMFQSFASVYAYRVNVELATSKAYALFNFYNTVGYLRTHSMTLTRTGTGACSLFANGVSFVPSQHTALTVDPTAAGYVANGLPAGANPNNDWRYPSNVSAF